MAEILEDETTYPTVNIPAGAGVVWPLSKEIPAGWSKNRMYGERNGYCFIMSDENGEFEEIDLVELDEVKIPDHNPFEVLVAFVRWLDDTETVKEWGNEDSAEIIAQAYLDSLEK